MTMIAEEKTVLRELFESLDRRPRPEEVAALVVRALDLKPGERKVIDVTRHSASAPYSYSSMSADFRRPVGMSRQTDLTACLLGLEPPARYDLAAIDAFVADAERKLGILPGATDFKADRLNREARRSRGIDISRRGYNKLFRLAARMEEKRRRLATEMEKRQLQQVSKSRLAHRITWEDLQDPDTAAFVAYFAAKCNLRSVFTNQSQDRPFDQVCEMLLARCESRPDQTNWWAIAQVYPDPRVLDRLTEEQKGTLLGLWYDVLVRLAALLRATWETSGIDRSTMIVRRGNDSSTWNLMAGAWNKARDGWIALLHALKMEGVLDEMCVGKVLRLMAADVAHWHRSTEGKLEPDTAVWNQVPLPWEVLSGDATCTRKFVEETCALFEVDPVKKGWTAPKRGGTVHDFKPTPELVHGVTVCNPHLAKVLRKLGAFSGKGVHWG